MSREDFIKSPINYTGNKYNILDQIVPLIDCENKIVVDAFSGGCTLGINLSGAKKVYFIESNERVVNLIKFLGEEDLSYILAEIRKYIKQFELTNSCDKGANFYTPVRDSNGLKKINQQGYLEMRNYYNLLKNKKTKKANVLLYLLIIYGYNNEIRFNSSGEFNVPCGKTDFNKNNFNKILEFNKKFDDKYEIICCDVFSKEARKLFKKADVVYLDPPYLITQATYNVSASWNDESERKLLKLIDEISKGKKIYLSNVLEIDGKTNTILSEYIENKKVKVHEIEQHYRSSSYNKKKRGKTREILVEV